MLGQQFAQRSVAQRFVACFERHLSHPHAGECCFAHGDQVVADEPRLGKIGQIASIGFPEHPGADILGIESVETLLREARHPTEIIPSNITFYPIRVGDNLVLKAAEFFNAGLPQRFDQNGPFGGSRAAHQYFSTLIQADSDQAVLCKGRFSLPFILLAMTHDLTRRQFVSLRTWHIS